MRLPVRSVETHVTRSFASRDDVLGLECFPSPGHASHHVSMLHEDGTLYAGDSVGVRIASALVLLLTAFRLAWPAFAYSIEDDQEARRTYGYVLTYLVLVTTWVATALALLSPWIVEWIAAPAFESS